MSVERQWLSRLLAQLADTAREVGGSLEDAAAAVWEVPSRAYPTQARVVAGAVRSLQRLAAAYELALLVEFVSAEDSDYARRVEAALADSSTRRARNAGGPV